MKYQSFSNWIIFRYLLKMRHLHCSTKYGTFWFISIPNLFKAEKFAIALEVLALIMVVKVDTVFALTYCNFTVRPIVWCLQWLWFSWILCQFFEKLVYLFGIFFRELNYNQENPLFFCAKQTVRMHFVKLNETNHHIALSIFKPDMLPFLHIFDRKGQGFKSAAKKVIACAFFHLVSKSFENLGQEKIWATVFIEWELLESHYRK